MNKSVAKHIRKFEILALCNCVTLKMNQLYELYNVSPDLIKLDFKELRVEGTGISSTKAKVTVGNKNLSWPERIDLYLRLRGVNYISSKAINNLFKILNENAAYFITIITKAIEHNREVNFLYGKQEITGVKPLAFHLVNDDYRFIGDDAGVLKQYSIAKIKSFDFECQLKEYFDKNTHTGILEIKDIKPNSKIEETLNFSFGGWISNNKIKVKLELFGDFKEKNILYEGKVLEDRNNSRIITGFVNSLEELAKYIIINSSRIRALEPRELQTKIILIANQIINSYK